MSTPKGFLLVFAEPGPAVPEAEYHDWYDNEHIPLRVNIPAFSSWARFSADDGQKPSWAAYYDLESYESTLVPPYSTLAETRSEREKDIFSKMEVLDRRTYEVYNPPEGKATPPSALYDPKKTAPYALIVGISVKPEAEEEFNRWYDEEHIPLLAKVPGWIRSRRFVLKEAAKAGTKATGGQPPKYLAVHEWASGKEREGTEEYKIATSTPWRTRLQSSITDRERRDVKFLKRWDRE
ncbi:uncharacterized protein STEHIDRAFT_143659 [Stereum hirsutum FP-91666 SS1]|uniref:uncharacterized protein n=1 Tax=Stereum hirsutum (strain FP-91666) TaxID=721885 RepID=UPI000440F482|nr:uncharacterized protein STEHIDRAFT_143659 [Stereum hirsutum FP-91666 SS1]EIM92242.1 hypothetical protein STEHIDRAFT_143659 [Stereum hirsutum FP-91666 SS1]